MCELIVVTNRKLCEGDFLDRIRLLCRVGVKKIVLREKDLNEKEYTKLAKDVLEICKAADVECIFHKYLFPALKLHAPGIHLPLPLAMKSSETAGELSEFGVSIHSVEQLYLAHACHVDYAFFGHVFATDCKPGSEPRGTAALAEICKKALISIYAIGGIKAENIKDVIEAGAKGACVMSFGMTASEEEIKELVKECCKADGRRL